MPDAPATDLDLFTRALRPIDAPHPAHAALRALGPIVRAVAPAGGPAWIVTDEALARRVFTHPSIVKDPAYAPAEWDPRAAGLEPTAAEKSSLTTLDGADHTRLRRAHAPLFTPKRMAGYAERIAGIARELLTDAAAGAAPGEPVDLAADFTIRYPLTVVCDLLGVPLDRVDDAAAACRLIGAPDGFGAAMAAFSDLAAAALAAGRTGLAVELRDLVDEDVAEEGLHYLVFTLIFAGQLTTDPTVGFLIARLLGASESGSDPAEEVREALRLYPPAPFTLWRFTAEPVELAGVPLPARAPVLIDLQGIMTDPARTGGPELAFGAGPHFCTGAHLARLELAVAVDVLRTDFPHARLAVDYGDLRQAGLGALAGDRLTKLPVHLCG